MMLNFDQNMIWSIASSSRLIPRMASMIGEKVEHFGTTNIYGSTPNVQES